MGSTSQVKADQMTMLSKCKTLEEQSTLLPAQPAKLV